MRIVQDRSLTDWEAYATTGEFGLPRPARIVFRSRSDPGVRPRQVVIDGDTSDAEARVRDASVLELRTLLERSVPLD